MTFKPLSTGACKFRKGCVTTNTSWEQPTNAKFNDWVSLVKEYIEMRDIQVNMYVCGKFIENPKLTWDVDVILSHPSEMDYTKIRDLMNYGMQLGFDKYNMFVDMAFYIPFGDDGVFWYSAEEYEKYGKIKTKTLYTFDKVEYDGKIIREFDACEEVTEGLFVVTKMSPSEKHINRLQNGVVYMKPILI